jgi:hypothetical protein
MRQGELRERRGEGMRAEPFALEILPLVTTGGVC